MNLVERTQHRRRQRRAACLVAIGAALFGAAACTHVEVALPGVLDLRSDGAPLEADRGRTTASTGAREGMDAAFGGAGVQTAGPLVTVEGRVWWLASLIRLSDGDVTDGWQAGSASSAAMRNVVVTEEITAAEAALFYCALPVPCAAAFLPTRTVRASGTRVVVTIPESAP